MLRDSVDIKRRRITTSASTPMSVKMAVRKLLHSMSRAYWSLEKPSYNMWLWANAAGGVTATNATQRPTMTHISRLGTLRNGTHRSVAQVRHINPRLGPRAVG